MRRETKIGDFTLIEEFSLPAGEPLPEAERLRLAKILDDHFLAMMTGPNPVATTGLACPPRRERCPDCGPFFQCAKHMVPC
jgi:hypothetical protein